MQNVRTSLCDVEFATDRKQNREERLNNYTSD